MTALKPHDNIILIDLGPTNHVKFDSYTNIWHHYMLLSIGIKIYDEISTAMIGNPLNPPDPPFVTKLASIGIGPGKTHQLNLMIQ